VRKRAFSLWLSEKTKRELQELIHSEVRMGEVRDVDSLIQLMMELYKAYKEKRLKIVFV